MGLTNFYANPNPNPAMCNCYTQACTILADGYSGITMVSRVTVRFKVTVRD